MKKTFLFLLTVLFTIVSFANPVDSNRAKEVGIMFMQNNENIKGQVISQLSYTYMSSKNIPCLYVFNINNNSYVVVAADDRSTPILGYSTEGTFSISEVPQALDEYLKGFVEVIQYAIDKNILATIEIENQWKMVEATGEISLEKSNTSVEPLISSLWNQGYPYNYYCPSDPAGSGGHTYTGCTGTAMAMIIRYWEYPIHGSGSHTYTPDGYPTQSVNFGNTTYQYSLMPTSLTLSSPIAQIQAVATLLWHCGVSLSAEYGPDGTSAYPSDVPNAMQTYYTYSSDISGEEKNDYSTTQWRNLLKTDLDQSRPIHYSGWNANGGGGHSFICDGYDANNYFHFNWGWSGNYNGYFAMNALNPGGSDFSYNNYAVVHIHPITYQISVVASPTAGGIVTGGGTYDKGTEVTITATANDGYSFVNWKKNGSVVSTNPEYTFTVTSNASYTAYFLLSGYQITATANPTEGGTIEGTGTYNSGTTATLIATPNLDYEFINWTENGNIVSTNSTYIFTVTGNRTLVANFTASSTNILSISNVTGEPGETVQISVSLDNQDEVVAMQVDIPLSSQLTYITGSAVLTNRATSSHHLIASIQSDGDLRILIYSIPGTVFNGNSGPIFTFNLALGSGEGTYPLVLTDALLSDWQGHGFPVTTVDGSVTIQGQIQTYTITATANPTNGGLITGIGTYNEGETAILTATPNTGYEFDNWTENGNIVSTNSTYSFTVTGDRTLIANFTSTSVNIISANDVSGYQGQTVQMSISLSNEDVVSGLQIDVIFPAAVSYVIGSIVLTDRATFNHQIVVSIIPSGALRILIFSMPTTAFNGSDGAICTFNIILSNNIGTFPVQLSNAVISDMQGNELPISMENGSVTINQLIQYVIVATANPTNGGVIAGAGTYAEGSIATLTATPSTGYDFVNWTENGQAISDQATYSFIVTSNRTLVAHFILKTYVVSATAEPTNGGTISGAGTYNYGMTVTLSATPSTGYDFVNWTENGQAISDQATYSFIATSNRTLVAHFILKTYVVSATAEPTNGGTISGAGTYNYGMTVTLSATPSTGYDFVNWTENGQIVSENSNYIFIVSSNRNLIANFNISILLGDANEDGVVDIIDAQCLISYLFGGNPQPFDEVNADVNQDSVINIIDLQCIINIIFDIKCVKTAQYIEPVIYTIENGKLYIETSGELSTIQVIMDSPIISKSDILSGFETHIGQIAGTDKYMLIAYNTKREVIMPGKYELMSVGDGKVCKMLFASPEAQEIIAKQGNILGIEDNCITFNAPYPNPFSKSFTLSYTIPSAKSNFIEVEMTDMMGRRVECQACNSDAGEHHIVITPSLELTNGVYIVNILVNGTTMDTYKVIYKR